MRALSICFLTIVCGTSAAFGCRTVLGIDEIGYEQPDERATAGTSGRETDSRPNSAGSAGAGGVSAPANGGSQSGGDAGSLTDAGHGASAGSAGSAGNAGSAGDRGGPEGPLALAERLALWLDGSSQVEVDGEGKVKTWRDRSSYGNDASVLPTSAPDYDPLGAPEKRGALSFSGEPKYVTIRDSASLRFGYDDFIVIVVAAYSNTPSSSEWDGYATLYVKANASSPYYGLGMYGNGYATLEAPSKLDSVLAVGLFASSHTPDKNDDLHSGAVSEAKGLNDGAFHVFAVERDNRTTLNLRLDGKHAGKNSIVEVDLSALGRPVSIGANLLLNGADTYVTRKLQGYIAEVIAVRGAISEAEIGDLESYLLDKYHLNSPP